MAVTWSNLTAPQGRLNVATLFPEDVDDGEERLTGYITDGTARATAKSVESGDVDSYVTAWAYYRAYQQKVEDMAADAGSASLVDQGQAAWSKDQRDTFKELAQYWLGIAEGFVPDTPIDTAPGVPASSTTDVVFGW